MDLTALFEKIAVESGGAAYAEPFDAASFLKMPANALVNVGYLILGLYWLRRVLKEHGPRERPGRRFFLWLAGLGFTYGFIQFFRIVTQGRLFGILDQWITLPFFGLVFAWNVSLHQRASPSTRSATTAAILFASTLSYGLALVSPDGFEGALAVHLVLVVASCLWTLKVARLRNLAPFLFALAACSAFVVLKKLDHTLLPYAPLGRLTGHFWSKIGDILQLHFVLRFFEGWYAADSRSLQPHPLPPEPPGPGEREGSTRPTLG